MDFAVLFPSSFSGMQKKIKFSTYGSIVTSAEAQESHDLPLVKVVGFSGQALARAYVEGNSSHCVYFHLDDRFPSIELPRLFSRVVSRSYDLSLYNVSLPSRLSVIIEVTDFKRFGSFKAISTSASLLSHLPSSNISRRFCSRYYISKSINVFYLHWLPGFYFSVFHLLKSSFVPASKIFSATEGVFDSSVSSAKSVRLVPSAFSFRKGEAYVVRYSDGILFDLAFSPFLKGKLLFVNSRGVYEEIPIFGSIVLHPDCCSLSVVQGHPGSLQQFSETYDVDTGVLTSEEVCALYDFVSAVGTGVLFFSKSNKDLYSLPVSLSSSSEIDIDVARYSPKSYRVVLRKILS